MPIKFLTVEDLNDIELTGGATVNGGLTVNDGVTVNGTALLADGADVDGALTVTGHTLTSSLGVNGNTQTLSLQIGLNLSEILPASVGGVQVTIPDTSGTLALTSGNVATATALATGRTIAATGDVTYTSPAFNGSSNVTAAATISAGAVTLAKMANLAQDQFIGRTTASTGVPETATITAAARTVLDDTTIAAMNTTLGVAIADPFALKNNVPGALDKWRKGLADVVTGTANTTIALAGTSINMGAYAGSGATANQCKPNAVNVRLAAMFNAAGIPAVSSGWFGNGHVTGVAPDFYDNRLTLTGSWAIYTAIGVSAGGYGMRATTTGNIAFAFTGSVDRLIIYTQQYGTAGAYSANIDGTTTITASQATTTGTVSVAALTHSFAAVGPGAHTLNIGWVSGSPIVYGADLYLSTGKVVRMVNCAMGSSSAIDWNSGGVSASPFYGPLFVLPVTIAPSLVLIDMGTNDWINGVTIPNFTTALTNIFTELKKNSSVIYLTPFPTSTSSTSVAVQRTYVDAAIGVCLAMGVPYIDEWNGRTDFATASTLGITQDAYHPNATGQGMRSVMMASALGITSTGPTTGASRLTNAATLDFGSIAAGDQADLTITVTGAAVGDSVFLGLPAAPAAGLAWNAFVSAADTVTVRASNINLVTAVDPASAAYRVTIVR